MKGKEGGSAKEWNLDWFLVEELEKLRPSDYYYVSPHSNSAHQHDS